MKNKKYKLDKTDTISVEGHKLYRIISLVDMAFVSKGEKGGYIEKKSNLSQEGNAWVGDRACVFGNAYISGDAYIFGYAQIYDDAQVYGYAKVYGSARVYGRAQVYGSTKVYDDAWIYGNAIVCCNAKVYHNTLIFGSSYVSGDAQIFGNARVYGNACVYERSKVFGYTKVYGNAEVYGNAQLCGYGVLNVSGNAIFCDEVNVSRNEDYFCVQSFGHIGRTTTFFRTKKGWLVVCGCFKGTVEQFREAIVKTHGDSFIAQEYLTIADLADLRINRRSQPH